MKLIVAKDLGIEFATSPQHFIKDIIKHNIFGKKIETRTVWKGLDFELRQGEILCVVGKNGTGKSTLLKIVAGLLQPDYGSITVGSNNVLLLAAGLGFTEELSGRDNIYYAGVFLGYDKKEIDEAFDSIVEFAELWEHIDKPFKYYSDGMKARLVFSLATTVTPDILLLDELISAGDLSFQEKVIVRLHELFKNVGCAILVTHSLEFARRNATRILYFGKDEIYVGDPETALEKYKKELEIA